MLNIGANRPARIQYLSGSFRVLAPGDHVICAVTGQRIPLNALRYWSAELQEAYATGEIAQRRFADARARGQV
jgi:hypothetical protein